ncbi:MAG: ABC transporter permease [Deltaproteobacteria bacterium]|nr:ABC transporter permease [Deltaproteobacteria bacterium]
MKRRHGRVWRAAQSYASLLGLVVLWQGLYGLGWLPEYLLGPSVIVAQFGEMVTSGELFGHLRSSLVRSYAGFLAGSLLGIGLGLLSGISRRAEDLFNPLISLTYPIPKIAILPVLIVWFGIGDASKILVILLACFYPVFINAYYGARAVDRLHVWSALNMGATPAQIFRRIVLPTALPQIFSGLRVALALSFILLFSAEMIGASSGLGFLISFAEANLRFDIMFVAIVTIAILGFANDRLLVYVRQRALTWEARRR